MSDEQKTTQPQGISKVLIAGGAGLVAGIILTLVAMMQIMPGLMLTQHESTLPFDETVTAIEEAVEAQGWVVSGTMNMNQSLAKHGVDFSPQVRIIKLCKPDYAEKVLRDDRYVAPLMPCSIAVAEADDGKVMVYKMNTGLMGRMFGGTVAEVMGGPVAQDEKAILKGIIAE